MRFVPSRKLLGDCEDVKSSANDYRECMKSISLRLYENTLSLQGILNNHIIQNSSVADVEEV